jgi:putative oxidoreductase
LAADRSLPPRFHDLAQLLIRLLLSYGFYAPFAAKLQHVQEFAHWLGRLYLYTPLINAWVVIVLQGSAVILFLCGLATRFMSIVLCFHLLVGLLAVHWPNGFSARENGYEIPLYYVLLLCHLAVLGPGRWSLDNWIRTALGQHQKYALKD